MAELEDDCNVEDKSQQSSLGLRPCQRGDGGQDPAPTGSLIMMMIVLPACLFSGGRIELCLKIIN
jgi:hypothetical protein